MSWELSIWERGAFTIGGLMLMLMGTFAYGFALHMLICAYRGRT